MDSFDTNLTRLCVTLSERLTLFLKEIALIFLQEITLKVVGRILPRDTIPYMQWDRQRGNKRETRGGFIFYVAPARLHRAAIILAFNYGSNLVAEGDHHS